MQKTTVKKQLVDYMIANGNDFRYTDVVKAILRICKGEDYVYTRNDRGYYATNLCKYGRGGYLVNGGGDCGLYKNKDGRYSAKYFSKKEKLDYMIKQTIDNLYRDLKTTTNNYDRTMHYIEKDRMSSSIIAMNLKNSAWCDYMKEVSSVKIGAQNKLSNKILKLDQSTQPNESGELLDSFWSNVLIPNEL